MKKELFGITREDVSDKDSYILEYYLLSQNILVEGKGINVYGVEIRKLIPFKNGVIEETGIVRDLFAQRDKTEQFIRLLTDCKVTPVHLKDIALDFAGGCGVSDRDVLRSA